MVAHDQKEVRLLGTLLFFGFTQEAFTELIWLSLASHPLVLRVS
jgi:hypothetical protein